MSSAGASSARRPRARQVSIPSRHVVGADGPIEIRSSRSTACTQLSPPVSIYHNSAMAGPASRRSPLSRRRRRCPPRFPRPTPPPRSTPRPSSPCASCTSTSTSCSWTRGGSPPIEHGTGRCVGRSCSTSGRSRSASGSLRCVWRVVGMVWRDGSRIERWLISRPVGIFTSPSESKSRRTAPARPPPHGMIHQLDHRRSQAPQRAWSIP